MGTIYALPIIIAISTAICYSVAKKRKANVARWVVLGTLLGPLAIPFVFFAKSRTP